MRVSEYFKLGKSQPYLDFVDVRIDTDIEVFLDPSAIKSLKSDFGHECASLLQTFFAAVLDHIKNDRDEDAKRLLASLSERNEFHLGFSSGKSKGHGFGVISGDSVWEALSKSKAVETGLLKDLEDTSLLIGGIGPDMISDAVCNIIRGPLIKYTQDICEYYEIPLTPDLPSGPIWNPQLGNWEQGFVSLPMADDQALVLIPKFMVRHRLMFRYDEYYRHYLLPVMQQEEKDANSALVEVLKSGRKRVTKKSLMEKYGYDKLSVIDQSVKRPNVVESYRNEMGRKPTQPLSHENISVIEETELPDWQSDIDAIVSLDTGTNAATEYEDLIESLLTSLFYPSLTYPTREHQIHDGRKRIDITYKNEARHGFFAWLAQHYSCAQIFVECKNYGGEVSNPAVDQLAGRFSPSRGQVGLLVCRDVKDFDRLLARCKDTANDQRGFILPLIDSDLQAIVERKLDLPESLEFEVLRARFDSLIN